MKRYYGGIGRIWLGILAIIFAAGTLRSQQRETNQFQVLSSEQIEIRLFDLINKERAFLRLPKLKPSAALTEISRRHSRDQSSRKTVDHLSASGLDYTSRLVAEDLYFFEHGENVAASETFVPEFIHQAFMQSPGHRANILHPAFTHAGIGIIKNPTGVYYITQDFFKPLVIEKEILEKNGIPIESSKESIVSGEFSREDQFQTYLKAKIKAMNSEIKRMIQKDRKKPFEFIPQADEYAKQLAESHSKERAMPLPPDDFWNGQIFFITAPELKKAIPEFPAIASSHFERGGVGIYFGRTSNQPGGAYTFVFLLFLERDIGQMSSKAMVELLYEEIQQRRINRNLPPIESDKRLEGPAKANAKQLSEDPERPAVIPSRLKFYHFISYQTQSLLVLPQVLKDIIDTEKLQTIGVGVVHTDSRRGLRGNFWIAIYYR